MACRADVVGEFEVAGAVAAVREPELWQPRCRPEHGADREPHPRPAGRQSRLRADDLPPPRL